MMINKENIRKWVDALRSGQYAQGQHRLRPEPNEYCCLGVACDISGVGTWNYSAPNGYIYNAPWERALGADTDNEYEWDISLPRAVVEWLGLPQVSSTMVSVPGGRFDGQEDLANLNDDREWTFEQIADLIEATYLTGED